MKFNTLMVQGTTSDAGKSAMVTGLCRYFYRLGINVAPFKPQNMALNSAVTVDGGEIGRAQAVQAAACNLPAHTDMNPILLKPNSDKTSQVIVHGKAVRNLAAGEYHHYKPEAMKAVLASYQRLTEQYQMVVVEGAGSPAEINLRDGDIANMGFAEAVDCPVILVADIDRGGVFAHIVGTLALLSVTERKRVIGFVINRFRGDIALLQPGLDWLEKETGKPVLAVLPYLHELYLESEDSLSSKEFIKQAGFNIVIPALPRMSNHTDFDPLQLNKELQLKFAKHPSEVEKADLIILPGSKSVRDDLAWLKQQGWDSYINRHLRYGGKVIGVCGGYQMLGEMIYDPEGIEGQPGKSEGLGLLAIETTLQGEKCLRQTEGILVGHDVKIQGYEIHAGISTGLALAHPVIQTIEGTDGAYSADNQVMGTYLHGLFDLPEACSTVLDWAGYQAEIKIDFAQKREQGIDLMADTLADHFDFSIFE